jgi:hypothetical protein
MHSLRRLPWRILGGGVQLLGEMVLFTRASL